MFTIHFDDGDDDSSCASTATKAALNVIGDKDERIELLTKQISEIKTRISESKVNLEKRNNSSKVKPSDKESDSSGTKAPAKSSGKKSGSSVTTTDGSDKKISKNAAKKAEKTARETFTGIGHGSDLPQIKLTKNQINKGLSLLEFLASSKILSSKSEARRAIANKGIKIDDVLVEDEKKLIHQNDFKNSKLKISYGKKKHFLLKII